MITLLIWIVMSIATVAIFAKLDADGNLGTYHPPPVFFQILLSIFWPLSLPFLGLYFLHVMLKDKWSD